MQNARVRWQASWFFAAALTSAAFAACGSSDDAPSSACAPGQVIACVGLDGCAGTQACKADGSGYDACTCAAPPADAAADTGADASAPTSCPTTFTFKPSASAGNIRLIGEWQGFEAATAPPMSGPDPSGAYTTTVDLAPGLWAYQITYVDGSQQSVTALDPQEGRRKYVGGVERSARKVADCSRPSFVVASSAPSRGAPGQGAYQAKLTYRDAIDGSGPDPAGFTAALVQDGNATPLGAGQLTVNAAGDVTIALTGLADGKYRVVVTARTKSGRASDPSRLVFWIEPEAYAWQDALVYRVMTDRFRNGDPTNDVAPTNGVDTRADFQGGDYQGIRQVIADGTLDKLGVRVLGLSPFATNPSGPYLASDGVHASMGYHGNWPVKAREVDARWGGATALHALVSEAHKHGIRVMQDLVLHHVHEGHEYVAAHPAWFPSGCVCGTTNCDWTTHARDCRLFDYLPTVDHTNAEANAVFVADAAWWVDTFDLDGVHIDYVKHMPEAITRNVAAELRETFEPGGTRFFLLGTTAMGWDDCSPIDPNCNAANYGTIAQYVGPHRLDGQEDFVLYYAAGPRVFAYGDKGLIHADYWFRHGQGRWPAGSIMAPYLGSLETPRFATLADYRGQDAAHDRGVPSNRWTTTAVAPSDAEPYRRARLALAWLLGLPGAPVLVYGDEYGQWGGAEPNNHAMWRAEAALGTNEAATLSFARKLGAARKSVLPLRRGAYLALSNTSDDTLVFGRLVTAGQASIVGLTRLVAPATVTFDASPLGFANGTVLHDAMGGPNVTVGPAGQTTITVPASGAVILSP